MCETRRCGLLHPAREFEVSYFGTGYVRHLSIKCTPDRLLPQEPLEAARGTLSFDTPS